MLSLAASRLAEAIQANVEKLPFPRGSFERIVLRQAWHFFDPRVASRELARVATPGALLVTGQIVPFGPEDAEYQEVIHRAKQPDLVWFPTEDTLTGHLAEAGWEVTATRELLIEEEMGAWLKWAPETGDRAGAVVKLVRRAPECYRRAHRVREDSSGLWDTFRWVIITARRPGASPRVSPALLEVLRCPHCGAAPLQGREDTLACASCAALYPVDAGVPRFRTAGDP
jgi:SAM-dependent methyltransferase